MKILKSLLLLLASVQILSAATIKYGTITITTTTANQTVLSYTPPSTETLKTITFSDYAELGGSSGGSTPYGTFTITLNGTTVFSQVIYPALFGSGGNCSTTPGLITIPLGDGLTFTGTDVLKVLFSPNTTTPNQTANASFFLN
jgi:hypothetical protein